MGEIQRPGVSEQYCENLKDVTSTGLWENINSVKKDIKADPTNGSNYADMAEIYLCAAAKKFNSDDVNGAESLLHGFDFNRSQRPPAVTPENADGALDALKLARKYGGVDTAKLGFLDLYASTLGRVIDKNIEHQKQPSSQPRQGY